MMKVEVTKRACGERAIMVNGERWGRIHCDMSHLFFQCNDGSDNYPVFDDLNVRYPEQVEVRIMLSEPKATEQILLEKACELVADGKLRDPKIVFEEDQANLFKRPPATQGFSRVSEKAAFRERAIKALGLDHDNGSHQIDAVVEAMRWAKFR